MVYQIAKYITFLLLIVLFVFGIYWLWQRQPKPSNLQTPQIKTTQTQKPQGEQSPDFKPADFSVLTTNKIKIEGKTLPDSFVVIFSNDIAAVTKSDSSGNFQADTTLANGLNLIDSVVISRDLSQKDQRSLTYFVSDNQANGNTVYVGTLKTIFDTLLTISTTNSEKSIQASKSTAVSLPPPSNGEKETTVSPLKNIRIGDYLIVMGDLIKDAENEKLQAKKIEVIRENIPQNGKNLTLAKTLTTVRQNLFSAKNSTDNQILEFTLAKTSLIQVDDKNSKAADIAKDKNAIIIWHENNGKNTVDLIYFP